MGVAGYAGFGFGAYSTSTLSRFRVLFQCFEGIWWEGELRVYSTGGYKFTRMVLYISSVVALANAYSSGRLSWITYVQEISHAIVLNKNPLKSKGSVNFAPFFLNSMYSLNYVMYCVCSKSKRMCTWPDLTATTAEHYSYCTRMCLHMSCVCTHNLTYTQLCSVQRA